MKILALAASAALSPLLLVGAPAPFTVSATEVACVVRGDAAEVRVAWDLAVEEPACGWISAELSRLPAATADREVLVRVDGKAIPARFEERDGAWHLGMDPRDGRIGPELEKAKRVRIETVFRGVPAKGGVLAVPLDRLRPLWRRGGAPAPADAPLRVKVVREGETGGASLEASFATASPGSRLEVTASEDALGSKLVAPSKAGPRLAGR